MKWIDRIRAIRKELEKILDETVDEDQKAATRSIMTCIDAWIYPDKPDQAE